MRTDFYCLIRKSIFILMLFIANVLFASEQKGEPSEDLCVLIMRNIGAKSQLLSQRIDSYNAEFYLKSSVEVKKRNFLMELAPPMFYFSRDGVSYLTETLTDISYISPDIYNKRRKATVGTLSTSRALPGIIMPFFDINIYSGTIIKNKFYSPLPRASQKFYEYKIVDTIRRNSRDLYKIKFYPRNRNNLFVSGYFLVTEGDWVVREMEFSGELEFFKFQMKLNMGGTENDFFLPQSFDFSISLKILGNNIHYLYTGGFRYKDIELLTDEQQKSTKFSYDLSKTYSLYGRYDINASEQRQLIDSLRYFPLSSREETLYESYFKPAPIDTIKIDTTQIVQPKVDRKQQVEDVLSFFWNPNKINLSPQGQINFSPIVNPLFIDYSTQNGLSYYQRTNYTHYFRRGGYFDVGARLAYNFKFNELQAELSTNYAYWPERQSLLKFQIGNRNRVYNSKIADYLAKIPEGLFDFDISQFASFNEFYWNAYNSLELMNGLRFNLGLNMNQYRTRKSNRVIMNKYTSEEDIRKKYFKNIRYSYTSLSPRLQLMYTPGQYYYMNNRNKINLYSNYPTFLLEYERGFDGKWNPVGKYDLIEFDMRHQLDISPVQKILYRVGTGLFINSNDIYFVNFSNFISSKISLPGWDSHSGGGFQLLRYHKYSTSKYYIQAHVTYQAPLLSSLRLGIFNKMIIRENLYLGTVFADELLPYNEIGYRVATGIVDLGVFVGFDRGKFTDINARVRLGFFDN